MGQPRYVCKLTETKFCRQVGPLLAVWACKTFSSSWPVWLRSPKQMSFSTAYFPCAALQGLWLLEVPNICVDTVEWVEKKRCGRLMRRRVLHGGAGQGQLIGTNNGG